MSELKTKCILYKCCQSCSFCNYSRATAKERFKTRSKYEVNKACQRCFLCRSLSFCPLCSKCPTCCHKNQCWGKTPELLASLAKVGFKSQGSFPSQGRLLSSFQGKATSQPLSLDCEQIRKPFQKQGPGRSSVVPKAKASSGKGGGQVLAGFLQPTLPSAKTQRTMASDLGSKPTQPLSVNGHFQDGNSGDNPVVTSARGMGHFAGLQRCLLPHPHCSEIQEVSKVSHEQGQLPLYFPSLWSSNCPVGIHQGGQGGQTNGSSKGYQDPPVPRRLVATSPFPGNLPTAYPDPLGPMSRTGLAGKHAKVRTGAPTGFQLRRLPVRPVDRSGFAHSGPASQSKREASVHQGSKLLYCSSVHVPDRSSDCDGKASVCWSAPYEANSVAPEASLACAGTSGEGNSGSQVSPSSFGLVVGRQQCASGSTFAPSSTRSSSLYRRFKRRLGRSLRRIHCKRSLVSTRRKAPHKFSGAEGGSLGPKEL